MYGGSMCGGIVHGVWQLDIGQCVVVCGGVWGAASRHGTARPGGWMQQPNMVQWAVFSCSTCHVTSWLGGGVLQHHCHATLPSRVRPQSCCHMSCRTPVV